MTMLWKARDDAGFSAPSTGGRCVCLSSIQLTLLAVMLSFISPAHAQWTASATGEFPEVNELSSLHVAAFSHEQRSFTQDSFAVTAAGSLFSSPELTQGQSAIHDFRQPGQAPVMPLRGSGDYQPLSAIAGRFQMQLDGGTYFFALPSLTRMRFGQSAGAVPGAKQSTGAEWVMGVGAGMGYRFSEKIGAEFTYEQIEQVDVYSVGARFRF